MNGFALMAFFIAFFASTKQTSEVDFEPEEVNASGTDECVSSVGGDHDPNSSCDSD